MQSSMFNLRVPLPAHDEVFLMNTMSDAQLIVSSDVAALLDRYATEQPRIIADSEREAVDLLEENGFLVEKIFCQSHVSAVVPRLRFKQAAIKICQLAVGQAVAQ